MLKNAIILQALQLIASLKNWVISHYPYIPHTVCTFNLCGHYITESPHAIRVNLIKC